MARSAHRDRIEGTLDQIAGRLLEAIGRMSGRSSYTAKGKAARARGAARTHKGQIKRAAH